MESDPQSVAHLAADLGRLGVAPGDLLMVHASLRAIGPVERGAAGVLEALERAVGPKGTLVMNLGARNDWDWVNLRPERDRPVLLREAEPFDCLATPADPDVGVLAEVFRTRQGTKVSDHPDGRFGAAGPLADQLLDNVPWDDYYGRGSPLERFVHRSGRVLRLGADMDTLTLLHYAEYLAPIQSKRRVRRHCLVAGRGGAQVRVVECLDDSDGIVEYPGEDYFAVILREYLGSRRAQVGSVGGANCELIEATDAVEFAVGWMAEHLSVC